MKCCITNHPITQKAFIIAHKAMCPLDSLSGVDWTNQRVRKKCGLGSSSAHLDLSQNLVVDWLKLIQVASAGVTTLSSTCLLPSNWLL